METKKLIIHHTAVSRDKNNNQFDAVNNYHKGLWNFKSKLGYYIGYHYFIEPQGELKQAREERERGAHTVGQNKEIGVCLTGNFDIEKPTEKQIQSLKNLVKELKTRYDLEIYFHRDFANYKSCPGRNFSDEYIKEISENELENIPKWAKLSCEKAKKKGIITKNFNENITAYRLATIFNNLGLLDE